MPKLVCKSLIRQFWRWGCTRFCKASCNWYRQNEGISWCKLAINNSREAKLSISTAHDHLKRLGLISKLGIWVPHIIVEINLCHRVDVYNSLLKRQENHTFLKHIITGDGKRILDNMTNARDQRVKKIKKDDIICLVRFQFTGQDTD